MRPGWTLSRASGRTDLNATGPRRNRDRSRRVRARCSRTHIEASCPPAQCRLFQIVVFYEVGVLLDVDVSVLRAAARRGEQQAPMLRLSASSPSTSFRLNGSVRPTSSTSSSAAYVVPLPAMESPTLLMANFLTEQPVVATSSPAQINTGRRACGRLLSTTATTAGAPAGYTVNRTFDGNDPATPL
jgi:hypothetical protein